MSDPVRWSTREARTRLSWSFVTGWMVCWGVLSLAQDLVGKETYIKLAQEHWVPGYVSVPIAIINLLLAAFFQFALRRIP